MFFMVSFDPIPRETGRPRRCFALPNLPIDPDIIPELKRGTAKDLKDHKGRLVPQNAGYAQTHMEEPQQNQWRWHSFHGDFENVKGDPSEPTWFGFTACQARYKKNTSAMFLRTWAWAGQLPPRAPRKADERAKFQYVGYQLKDEASVTMWQRARSETPVFSREATLVSPSPAPVKTAVKSTGVKREPKSVSFKTDPPRPNGRFPVRTQAEQDEESDL
ncbi:hypothetical protein F5883DRAFT_529779 [Diaporthe sp. PMI_573]|nr:hypothetical protein F5883DRAFT_529779 [Diaporthaceae sp. PMI_573]